MSLTGKTLASAYKSLLRINDDTNGIDTIVETVTDGEGTVSAISLSDDVLHVKPQVHDTNSVFKVFDKDTNPLLAVDAANDVVKLGAGQHYANTNIKDWFVQYGASYPATANTWRALGLGGGGRTIGNLTMGTGSTPSVSPIAISTNAHDVVGLFWYVPFNITIDSCHVWVASDTAIGDVIKFSVMDYAINTTNGATGGDLSSGVESCVSPATITSAGYEQAYYQLLSISSADVDAGRAIMACVSQDGTNSDLSVNLQLVYHLR